MSKYEDSIDVPHEAKKYRLIAAALELQHFTSAAAHVMPIPGGDQIVAIGTPAQVRALLADAPGVSEQDERAPGEDAAWEKYKELYSENAQRHGSIEWRGFRRGWQARAAHPAPQAAAAEGELRDQLQKLERHASATFDLGGETHMRNTLEHIADGLCAILAAPAQVAQDEPVAWAVTAQRGSIHKLSITKASADRKAARWEEEWPNNGCRVRPLVFCDQSQEAS